MRVLRARLLTIVFGAAFFSTAAGDQSTIELSFADHISSGLIEQDVFVERAPGAVYRVEPEELEMFKDAELFTTKTPMHHAPFNPNAKGPYFKGESLGMSLNEWLSGRGIATYSCSEDTGTLKTSREVSNS